MNNTQEMRFWEEEVTVSFTPLQTRTIMAILGLNVTKDGYTAFSDETLRKFWNMKENPLLIYDRTWYDEDN